MLEIETKDPEFTLVKLLTELQKMEGFISGMYAVRGASVKREAGQKLVNDRDEPDVQD